MSKVLAELLGIDDPLFTIGVQQLELASGQSGIDVRLYSEIISKSHQKLRELGLDPRDTTGLELYQALMELMKKHDEFLARRLGSSDPTDVKSILKNIESYANQLKMPKSVWALKPAVAKRLLRATPPKKVMKQLGYRSIDSMLKRESIAELYLALRFVESPDWLTAFTKKYKDLLPKDFETRDIEIIKMAGSKWGVTAENFVRRQRHNLTHMKEMGAIAILPLPVGRLHGVTVAVLPLLLHYVSEIRMYTTFFKTQQIHPDFGKIIVRTLNEDPKNHARVGNSDVHWRTIQRHLGKPETSNFPEIFEPHVQAEDLYWRKAEEVLFRIEPALHFWNDIDFVALKTKQGIVSFSLMDVATSYVNKLPFNQRSLHHFRASLQSELFIRYIGHPALEHQVMRQFSDISDHAHHDKTLEQMFI